MNKAIKINLSGIIFHIDDDAYEKLKSYLDSISRHFSNKEESKEIVDDIEARIAELFQERITAEKQVITLDIVNKVIDIMGNPEDIGDPGEEPEEPRNFHESYTRSRRLYRDPENSVIGGVCGGLSAYFNVDPIIFRLLFVVFFFAGGASILVYIILWIVLPNALTAAQKLEMRGEQVTVSNIEKKVREEYDNVKESVKEGYDKARSSKAYKRTEKAGSDFFDVLGKILLVFVKIILIVIGASLAIAGIGILIGLIALPFAGLHFFPFESNHFSLGDILIPFTDPLSVTLLTISFSLLILIPVGAMFYGILKLIFNFKTRSRGVAVGAITLWLVCLFTIIGIVAFESSNYSELGHNSVTHELDINSDTLYIAINEDQGEYLEDDAIIDFNDSWILPEDAEALYGSITIDIEKAQGEHFALSIDKESKGKNWDRAKENASHIDYAFHISGNKIVLDPYFAIDLDHKWRFPEVEATLMIPEGKVVVLDRDTRNYLDGIRNVNHHSDWNMAGKTWIMTEEGLELFANLSE